MASFLTRYLAGEHVQVWAELVALGPRVREPNVMEDTVAVADETMRRVARNADLIVEALGRAGFVFAEPEHARELPADSSKEYLAEVEKRCGPIPLSLRSCLIHVGTVWLTGYHPDWPSTLAQGSGWGPKQEHSFEDLVRELSLPVYADPLCVPQAESLLSSLVVWDEDEHDEEWPARPFEFPFAPDELNKANVSGGASPYILLPDEGADPIVHGLGKRPGIRLVQYLRTSLGWAGFPGFEFLEAPLPRILQDLRTNLIPI